MHQPPSTAVNRRRAGMYWPPPRPPPPSPLLPSLHRSVCSKRAHVHGHACPHVRAYIYSMAVRRAGSTPGRGGLWGTGCAASESNPAGPDPGPSLARGRKAESHAPAAPPGEGQVCKGWEGRQNGLETRCRRRGGKAYHEPRNFNVTFTDALLCGLQPLAQRRLFVGPVFGLSQWEAMHNTALTASHHRSAMEH